MSTTLKKEGNAVTNMSGIDEISTLMNSRRKAILAYTFEEERLQEDLKALIDAKGQEGFVWSITSSVRDLRTGEVVIPKMHDPIKFLDHIEAYEGSAVFIIKDFHDIWTNFQAKRRMRDILEASSNYYKPIILISPQLNIPMELEKLITMVTYDLPTREQVEEQLEGIEAFLIAKDLPVLEGRDRTAVINALVGMTKSEIVNVLKKSVAKHKRIALEEIVAEKEQVIKKTGLLEYVTKLGDMNHVGGMDTLKDWLDDAQFAFEFEAKEYKVDPIRGVIVAGFPGTGKSLLAKSISHQFNLPLLKMSMSGIMDSKVGQSEKNIDRALKLAESISPCVLWLDELEKALSGMGSSDKSDGGTTSRVISSLLTWLSDKEAPVFMVATANDITKLSAELTRAGRFDDIFFVSVPAQTEREDIFRIHLQKRGYNVVNTVVSENDIQQSVITRLAEQAIDFTGAEIEQVISEAGRRAYAAFRKNERATHYMTECDIQEQITALIPLSKRNPTLLANLRDWARSSAKCASSHEHALIHGLSLPKSATDSDLPDVEFDF